MKLTSRIGSLTDNIITGFLLTLGMAETGHLLMVFGHRPFSDAVICFVAGVVICFVASLVLLFRQNARGREPGRQEKEGSGRELAGKDITPTLAGIALVFGLIVLFQVITVAFGDAVVLKGDQTIETVQSILETGQVYAVNPLTGQAYTAGVPKRIKILGLPTFYAILCRLAGVAAGDVQRGGGLCYVLLTRWMPVVVLFLTYLAYWTIARVLFPTGKDREKRLLFMAVVAAVFFVGNYMFGMDGYGLLYCGYRGITIRNGILVPYTLGLTLRGKWKRTLLCVAAEACIVWTFYGMGTCVLVTAGMGALCLLLRRKRGALRVVRKEE